MHPSNSIVYKLQQASEKEIFAHLSLCATKFVPPLSTRVNLNDYSKKIHDKASTFESWSGFDLVGLVAVYISDAGDKQAFITNVSVLPAFLRKGIALRLMSDCLIYLQNFGCSIVQLEVGIENLPALELYTKMGFYVEAENTETLLLRKQL